MLYLQLYYYSFLNKLLSKSLILSVLKNYFGHDDNSIVDALVIKSDESFSSFVYCNFTRSITTFMCIYVQKDVS